MRTVEFTHGRREPTVWFVAPAKCQSAEVYLRNEVLCNPGIETGFERYGEASELNLKTKKNMSDIITHNQNEDGVDRRGFLKCMAWAGTGVLWSMTGGILRSQTLRPVSDPAAMASQGT